MVYQNLFKLQSESDPGVLCLYHVDLESMRGGNASDIITDIAIQNPTQDPIEFSWYGYSGDWSQWDYEGRSWRRGKERLKRIKGLQTLPTMSKALS